jgi:tetratricopeptide (TPR) repeat protein
MAEFVFGTVLVEGSGGGKILAALLLGFVILCVVVAGLVVAFALYWYAQGFGPFEAVAWKKHGFTRNSAVAWRSVPTSATPEAAVAWVRAGLTPADAQWCAEQAVPAEVAVAVSLHWANARLPLETCVSWARQGFGPGDYAHWSAATNPAGELITPEEVQQWLENEIDPRAALSWFAGGIAPGRHMAWLDAACDPGSAGVLHQARVEPHNAQAWLSVLKAEEVASWTSWIGDRPLAATGWTNLAFAANEAQRWHSLGIDPADAREWRDAGFVPDLATLHWRELFLAAPKAQQWRAVSTDPDTAAAYRDIPLDLAESRAWAGEGIAPLAVEGWRSGNFAPAVARNWDREGFAPDGAAAWRNAEFQPEMANDWRREGFESEAAAAWRLAKFDATGAGAWRKESVEVEEAEAWKAQVPAISDAVNWRRERFSPSEAAEWIALVPNPETARPFADYGILPRDAAAWISLTVTAEGASDWQVQAFDPASAAPWLDVAMDPEEARLWLNANWSAPESAAWKAEGFSASDARAWQTAATTPSRAAAFRALEFDRLSETDRAWMQSRLSSDEAAGRRRQGLQPDTADEPLPDVLANLALPSQAALLGDVGVDIEAEDQQLLAKITSWDRSDDGLIEVLACIGERHRRAGATQALLEACGLGQAPGLRPADVVAAGTATFDDLLEQGSRSPEFLAACALQLSAAGDFYGIARLAPESLDNAQLESLKHDDELARRAFLEDPATDLAGFAPSPLLAQLRQLQSVLEGDLGAWKDHPPTEAARIAADGPEHAPDLEALASDTTLWHLVRPQVVAMLIGEGASFHLDGAAAEFGAWALSSEGRERFSEWNWHQADQLFEQWGRVAPSPAHKAEALNCRAAIAHLDGNVEEALKYLEVALAMHEDPSLFVNRAVLLADSDPGGAVEALANASLASRGSQAVDLGLAAMHRYLDAENLAYGTRLRTAIRAIATGAMPLDDHHRLMRVMVEHDSDWVAVASNTRSSPLARSWEHRVRVAQASGPSQYIDCLGQALTDPDALPWVEQERLALVRGVIAAMEDDDPPPTAPAIALLLVEHGFLSDPVQKAAVLCYAVRSAFATFDLGEDDPADALAESLLAARKDLARSSADDRSKLEPEINSCLDLFVLIRRECIRASLGRAAIAHDHLIADFRASGGGWAARRTVRGTALDLIGPVTELETQLRNALELATDVDVRSETRQLADAAGELRRSFEEMTT